MAKIKFTPTGTKNPKFQPLCTARPVSNAPQTARHKWGYSHTETPPHRGGYFLWASSDTVFNSKKETKQNL